MSAPSLDLPVVRSCLLDSNLGVEMRSSVWNTALPHIYLYSSFFFLCDAQVALGAHADEKERSLADERRALYVEYVRCSSQAVAQMLSAIESRDCSNIFMRLKLTFLPDFDFEKFKALPPRSRAEINRKGYAAYRDWLTNNLTAVTVHPIDPSSEDFTIGAEPGH